MNETYKVFKRSAKSFEEFATADKVTIATGLSYAGAQRRCSEFNDTRTSDEVANGTKLEFTKE